MRAMFTMAMVLALAATGAARQGRPHLQVLSDIPESQLFLVMNAVAGSLGVGCAYCHVRDEKANPNSVVGGWLFDRDDKPTKAKGREMMRMVREINATRFGGRPVVTCYTCHRGDTRVATLPQTPPRDTQGAEPPPPVMPSARDVLQKYIAAVGGTNAATRFATIVMEGRDERSEGRKADITVSLKGSDRFRVDLQWTGQAAIVQGFNASGGWTAAGPPQAIAAADLAELRRKAARYAPLKVVDAVDALRVDRIESIRGRDAYVAVASLDANRIRAYFFDVTTGLLLRESVITPTALLPLQEQVEYDDYRSVDGVMLPFLIRSSDDAPYDTSTRTFTRIRHDVPLDDELFVIPKASVQSPQPAGVTQTAAPSQLARDRYKSVHVLTDIPASSIIPAMAFIANSLGVTCAHCHTEVYESDEKPMKDKARQMIRMTRALNDAQYGSRRVVTCQTCHSGRAVPDGTPVVENAGWNARPAPVVPAPLPTVDLVLQRYERAVGRDAFKPLQSQTATGTITRNNGRTSPASDKFELVQELPRTLRLSTALSHPPEADAELAMTFIRPPLLASSYRDLRVVGRERINEPVVVVEGTSSRGTVHRLYFSEQTGLLVRRTDEIETPLGNLPERYDFSEFRKIDGVQVPMRIVWSRADYQVTFAFSAVQHKKQR